MSNILRPAKELVNLIIKNSEIVQPFVKPKHYIKAMFVLNGLYLALKMADNQSSPNPNQQYTPNNPYKETL